jgi:hypothetical protein
MDDAERPYRHTEHSSSFAAGERRFARESSEAIHFDGLSSRTLARLVVPNAAL